MADGDERDPTPPPGGDPTPPPGGDPTGVAPSPPTAPGPAWASAPPPPDASSTAPPTPGPPSTSDVDRLHWAWSRRAETDYIFDYWTALGWTILTLGIYGLYVFYQLVRRMRDHNVRRLELLDASLSIAWTEAGKRGLQEELTPSFQRAAAHMDVLRRMTTDFRDPVIWLILSIIARGIVEIIAFVLLDQDLVRHDQAEVGVEYELALIYGRFGQQVLPPDQSRVKGYDNYVGRIVASIFSLGIYLFWWYYDQMIVPNNHFRTNWAEEDSLVAAVQALR